MCARSTTSAGAIYLTGHMALSWKLVIDSTNAPAQADFWAAALEYEVEDPSALIQQLLAAGRIGAEAVVEHRGRQIFRGYAAIRHPEDAYDETSGIGRGRRLLFQEVPERKSGKNRLHIDVHSESRRPRQAGGSAGGAGGNPRPRGRQGTCRELVDHAGSRGQRVLRGLAGSAACGGTWLRRAMPRGQCSAKAPRQHGFANVTELDPFESTDLGPSW